MLLHSLNCLIIVMLIIHTCGDFVQKRLINEPNFPESVDAFFDTGSQEDLEDNFSNLRFMPSLETVRHLEKRSTDDRSMASEKRTKINYNSNSDKTRAARILQKKKRHSSRLSKKLTQDIQELNGLVQFISERSNTKFTKKKLKKRIETSMKPILTTETLQKSGKLAHAPKAGDIIIINYDDDYDDDIKKRKIYAYQYNKRKTLIGKIPEHLRPTNAPLWTLYRPTSSTTTTASTTKENLENITQNCTTCNPDKKLKLRKQTYKTDIIWPETVKKIIREAEEKIKAIKLQMSLKRTNRQKRSNFGMTYNAKKIDEEVKKILEDAEKKIYNQEEKLILSKALPYRKIRNTRSSFVSNKDLKQDFGDTCAIEKKLEPHKEQCVQELDSVEPVYAREIPQTTDEYYIFPISTYADVEFGPSRAEEMLPYTERTKGKRKKRKVNFPDLPVHQVNVNNIMKQIKRVRFLNEKMQKHPLEKNTIPKLRSLQKLSYLPTHYIQRRSDETSTTPSTKTVTQTREEPEDSSQKDTEVTIPEPITLYHSPIFLNLPINPPDCTDDDGSFENYYLQQMFPSTETEYSEATEAGEPPSGATDSTDVPTTESGEDTDSDYLHESHPEEHDLEENLKFPEKTENEQEKKKCKSKEKPVHDSEIVKLQKVLANVKKKLDTYVEQSNKKNCSAEQKLAQRQKSRSLLITKRQNEGSAEEDTEDGNDDYGNFPTDTDENETTEGAEQVIEELEQQLHGFEEDIKTHEKETGKKSEKAEHLLSDLEHKLEDYEKQKETTENSEIETETETATSNLDETTLEEMQPMHAPDEESDKSHPEQESDTENTTINADELLEDIESEIMEYEQEAEKTSTVTVTEFEDVDTEESKLETTENAEKLLDEIQHQLEEYESHTKHETVTTEESESHETETVEEVINDIQHELKDFEDHVEHYEEATTNIPEPEEESTEEIPTMEESEPSESLPEEVPSTEESELTESLPEEIPSTEESELTESIPEEIPSTEESELTESIPEEIPSTEESELTESIPEEIPSTEESELTESLPEESTTEEHVETTSENTEELLGEIKHELDDLESHIEHEEDHTEETNENDENITEETESETPSSAEEAEEMLKGIEHELEEYQKHEEAELETIENNTTYEETTEVEEDEENEDTEENNEEITESEISQTTNNTVLNMLEKIEHQLEDYNTQHTSTETPTTSEQISVVESSTATEEPLEEEAEHLLDNINQEIKNFKEEHEITTIKSTTVFIESIIHTIKAEIEQYKEQKESETDTSAEDEDLYTELGVTNHEIILSNKCKLSQFRAKDHCICSVNQMLQDLMDDIKEINKSSHYEYTCRRFIRIDPGIIITNKSESKILRKRKTGDFTNTFIWKREARVGRDIESLLRKEIHLPAKGNLTYVIAGSKVTIPCYDKIDIHENVNYTWTVHNGAPETTGDRRNNGSSIVIPAVSPEDTNNYTCQVFDSDSHQKSIHTHWLSVVSLPLYSLVVTVHLNASSQCQEGDLEILNLYYPVAIKDLLCSGAASMCSVTVEKPQCIRLREYNSSSCNVNGGDLINNISKTDSKGMFPAMSKSCIFNHCEHATKESGIGDESPRLNYRTAQLTPIQNNRGDKTNVVTNSINTVCPAGFGIFQDPKICLACEPYTFNPGNEMHCQKCPRGTFQRAVGSRMCLPCASFLDDPSCLLPGNVADFSRKYYLIPVVMMILILMLIGGCMMLQKRRRGPFLFRKSEPKTKLMNQKTRDEERDIASAKSSKEIKVLHSRNSDLDLKKSRSKSNKKTAPEVPPIDF